MYTCTALTCSLSVSEEVSPGKGVCTDEQIAGNRFIDVCLALSKVNFADWLRANVNTTYRMYMASNAVRLTHSLDPRHYKFLLDAAKSGWWRGGL